MLQQMGLHHLAISRTTTRAPNFRDRIIVGIGLGFDGCTWLVQVLFVDHPTARGGTMLWNFGTWEWPSSGSQARASPVDFHELMVRWCQMWEGHWGVWNQGASTRKSHGVCFTTSRGRSYKWVVLAEVELLVTQPWQNHGRCLQRLKGLGWLSQQLQLEFWSYLILGGLCPAISPVAVCTVWLVYVWLFYPVTRQPAFRFTASLSGNFPYTDGHSKVSPTFGHTQWSDSIEYYATGMVTEGKFIEHPHDFHGKIHGFPARMAASISFSLHLCPGDDRQLGYPFSHTHEVFFFWIGSHHRHMP